jgi:hypothetical protein
LVKRETVVPFAGFHVREKLKQKYLYNLITDGAYVRAVFVCKV